MPPSSELFREGSNVFGSEPITPEITFALVLEELPQPASIVIAIASESANVIILFIFYTPYYFLILCL